MLKTSSYRQLRLLRINESFRMKGRKAIMKKKANTTRSLRSMRKMMKKMKKTKIGKKTKIATSTKTETSMKTK
jgi:hypothetical protein